MELKKEKDMQIVKDIIDAIKTKKLSLGAEKFVIHWLSNEEKIAEDRDIIRNLALSGVFPTKCDNLFRGCKNLVDGNAESYSISIREAARFAGKDGYVIAVDTSKTCFYSFDFSEFVYSLIEEIITGVKENCYSDELISTYEEFSGESEVFLITDLDSSVVLSVHSIGNEL